MFSRHQQVAGGPSTLPTVLPSSQPPARPTTAPSVARRQAPTNWHRFAPTAKPAGRLPMAPSITPTSVPQTHGGAAALPRVNRSTVLTKPSPLKLKSELQPATALVRPKRPSVDPDAKHAQLRAFQKKYLGIENFDATEAKLGEFFYHDLARVSYDVSSPDMHWRECIPTRWDLYRSAFGRPSLSHSFHQVPCLDTCSFHLLQSGFLSPVCMCRWFDASPVMARLAATMVAYQRYDFRWAKEYNLEWASQQVIDPDREAAYTAILLHYKMDVSLLMRYLGNNFTGEYRDVEAAAAKLRHYNIPEDMIQKYRRVLLVGCPAHFVAECSRENALLYLRMRNGPTIARKLDQVKKTMNKEDKNNFVIPLPSWLAPVIPHLFFTPQHILEKPGKKDRQIFDGSKRYNAHCTSLNMMTSTHLGVEDDCLFGDVRERIWTRTYNLRVTYPCRDIIVHANDVKSCFRQLKLHPDSMGAFSYLIANQLFLSCGLPFGTDFSPQNWEPLRRILERLAEELFYEDSLRDKHRKYLDQVEYDQALGHSTQGFSQAVPDRFNRGVLDAQGEPVPTPHAYYVDDGVYVEVFDTERVERALAASIEAIFILLGDSDLAHRQDAVSFDKMIEMLISHFNRVLGHMINTRTLEVGVPQSFISEVITLLDTTWGEHRRRFKVKEAEELTGKLLHIALTAPWLKFLLGQVYQSLACALKLNEEQAVRTCRSFQDALKQLRRLPQDEAHETQRSFYQASMSRHVHNRPDAHNINKTLRKELRLIRRVLKDDNISKNTPISHLIPREPVAVAYGDSSLDAAGGFCPDLGFWWYIEWPSSIKRRTLRHVKNNKRGDLIDINLLEYATNILMNVIACHRIQDLEILTIDPFPHVLYFGDNTSAESWATKGAKHSPGARALGRLQSALMVNNPVHFRVQHIPTAENVVADKISRILRESLLTREIPLIQQEHPELAGCRRYHLSSSQVSCLLETLLQAECLDPIEVSRRLLTAPGRITT